MTNNTNWLGMYTVYAKETRRFLKVYNQTLFAPVITALLFLAIFNLALGKRITFVEGVPFGAFMAAGLVMMSIVQNAFANTSSSLTMGKVLGTIIDYLMPPLAPLEITIAMTSAAITRGLMVGTLVLISVACFIPLSFHNPFYMLFYAVIASLILALIGMISGIIAETFDQNAAITSYIITPLAFLSGTFYSVKNLPEFWHNVVFYNPFFYMIDGFRYGMTGYHDGNLTTGSAILIFTAIVLWITVHIMLSKGYRIKN